MKGLATPKEVAEYLGVKEQTLRLWATKRRGPSWIKVEGVRRYLWADVEQYLNDRKVSH